MNMITRCGMVFGALALVLAAAAPAPASADASIQDDCAHGASFLGWVEYKFNNGSLLHANFCGYRNLHSIISARIGYKKVAGSCVNANFQWYWVTRTGDAPVLGGTDRGAFNQCVGQPRGFGWDYAPPGSRAPNAASTCVTGALKVNRPYEAVHKTRVVCF